MINPTSTARPWLSPLVLGLVVGGLAQGCSPPRAPAPSSVSGTAEAPPPGLPPGTVEVGDQLYQVPIGEDDDGCARYRLYSPTKLVAQVISYRARAGGFTTDRQKADCATKESD